MWNEGGCAKTKERVVNSGRVYHGALQVYDVHIELNSMFLTLMLVGWKMADLLSENSSRIISDWNIIFNEIEI